MLGLAAPPRADGMVCVQSGPSSTCVPHANATLELWRKGMHACVELTPLLSLVQHADANSSSAGRAAMTIRKNTWSTASSIAIPSLNCEQSKLRNKLTSKPTRKLRHDKT